MTMIKDNIIRPYDPDLDLKLEEQYNQLCTCGHELYMHGFVHYSAGLLQPYISVSQCVVSNCRCSEFDPVNKENLY